MGCCPGKTTGPALWAPVTPPVKRPSAARRALNFIGSLRRFVAAGRPTVSAEEKAARLSVCHICKYRSNRRCTACGCNLDVKAGWATEDCPLSRWAKHGTPEALITVDPTKIETFDPATCQHGRLRLMVGYPREDGRQIAKIKIRCLQCDSWMAREFPLELAFPEPQNAQ